MPFESYKTVEDSRTEWMKCIQYEDINGNGRLFGGRLMEWMDEVAGIAATRHCGGYVTTAAIDNLQFKKGAFINEIIVIRAKLTYVGRTSMEVRVDVYVEERDTGIRRVINRAYFTEVYVDDAGKPLPLKYGLTPETEVEKAEWEGAKKRLEIRRQRRVEGF
jgi:acyl-CoA hydrolase